MSSRDGYIDTRNAAELLLAPAKPASRKVVNFSALKLDIGGTLKLPGAITSLASFSGPLRSTFSGALVAKQLSKTLTSTLTSTIGGFDAARAGLQAGTRVMVDPMFASPSINGIPTIDGFLQFSTLRPGQAIPASFKSQLDDRKRQMQALAARMGSAFSTGLKGGVSITENFNRIPYPLAEEVDAPSTPRLAQGGSAGKQDPILKDKIRFVVNGVQIGSGKPSIWSRLLSLAQIKALPNLNPVVNQIFKDRKNQSGWSEPPSPYAAQFPYNKVQQTESGHVMEFDDTPGAERVHVFHRSGSFIEMHPDGTVVYKTMKNGYSVTMGDQHVKVSGVCHVSVDGNATLYVKGNVDMQSEGSFNIQTKKDFNVYAQNINLRAKKTFKGDGTKIDLRYINLPFDLAPSLGGFVPKVSMTALLMDFPTGNFASVLANFAKNPLNPLAAAGTLFGNTAIGIPLENPLSNPAVYTQKTPAAAAYRARLFDTPEETGDFELYTAHVDLQTTLGDGASTDGLGGKLSTPVAPSIAKTTPTVNYLNPDTYQGKFSYANSTVLGGTTFRLSDLVDLASSSTIVKPLVSEVTNLPTKVTV